MKKILALILSLIITLSFFGCDNTENINLDINTVADALNSGLSFDETLEKSTADALYSVYGIDETLCKDAAFYANSGAVADEIAVFECVDESAADEVMQAINKRIEYLRNGYSSYGPEQVPKIDNAPVVTAGNIIIFCVCNNPEKVNEIIYSTSVTQ